MLNIYNQQKELDQCPNVRASIQLNRIFMVIQAILHPHHIYFLMQY